MGDFIRVHCRHCKQSYVTPSSDLSQCGLCLQPGGVVSGDAVLEHEVRALVQTSQVRHGPSKGPYPVSPSCPKCEGVEFRIVRPDRWVAFRHDRVCKACQTRYVPPTPPWGAIVMTVVGFVMLSLACGAILTLATGDVLGLACGALVGILGLLAVGHGVRSLLRPGKV